jgi:hypothetical protein
VSAPTLAEVAGWEVPLLRGAVGTLDSVAGGLPAWRARVEAVGRSLADASCWYGPAAQSAAAALVEVSTVATAVTAALGESLEHAQRLLAEAETAQELAEQALAAAASIPVVLDGAGRLVGPLPVDPTGEADAAQTAAVVRVEALAADALAAAARAGLGAGEAAAALMGLGIGGTLAPAAFEDLSWLVAVEDASTPAPPPSSGNDPTAVAAWWAGLSTAARVSAIHGRPGRIGDLEGLPAWARDRANRLVLDRTLVTPRRTGGPPVPGQAMAVSVAAEIARREASGEKVQLLQFDPGAGLTALGLGDLDTAESVAFVVPGMLNSPERTVDDVVATADTVADAGRAADPGLAVAAVAWFGYRPPMGIGALARRPVGRAALPWTTRWTASPPPELPIRPGSSSLRTATGPGWSVPPPRRLARWPPTRWSSTGAQAWTVTPAVWRSRRCTRPRRPPTRSPGGTRTGSTRPGMTTSEPSSCRPAR